MGGTRRSHAVVDLGLAAIAAIAACAGCTSSSHQFVPYRTHFGQQAIELARHVPECSDISAPGGFSTRDWSVAVCWIDQRQVNFYAFTSAAAASQPEAVLPPRAFAGVDVGSRRQLCQPPKGTTHPDHRGQGIRWQGVGRKVVKPHAHAANGALLPMMRPNVPSFKGDQLCSSSDRLSASKRSYERKT